MNEFHRHAGAYWHSPQGRAPNWPPSPPSQPLTGPAWVSGANYLSGATAFSPPPVQHTLPQQGYPAAAAFDPAVTPQAPTQRTYPSLLANPRFIKGALVGAAAAYLLSNESVQQNAIKAAVKAWSLLQGGIEEMKERFRDAEAELHAAATDED